MPINKIVSPSEVPASVDDYSAQNNLTEALLLAVQGAQRIVGANVAKGAVFLVGGATYLADADTAITGTASDYVKLTPSVDGLTLAPSFVANLTGVTWSSTWNGYYDASGNLYEFDELKALASAAIAAASLRAIGGKNLAAGWAASLILPAFLGVQLAFLGAISAGNYYLPGCRSSGSKSVSFASNTKIYEIKSPVQGNIRVRFAIVNSGYTTLHVKVYKNNTGIGTERSASGDYYEDIAVNKGDLIQLYGYVDSTGHADYATYFGLCSDSYGFTDGYL